MRSLEPGSPEWRRVITASKVAAIFGLSPYESPYSLWQLMKGNIAPEPQNDIQSRGHFLEPAILAWWADKHGIDLSLLHQQETFWLDDWAAATPDGATTLIDGSLMLVEAKTAAKDEDWGEPDTAEIPTHYLMQAIWQMHVSGARECRVPMLDKYLTFREYVVCYDDFADDAAVIEKRAREFYDSLASDVTPDLDDTKATLKAVKRLHPEIDDETVEADRDLATHLVDAVAELKRAEANDRLWRSKALTAMSRAKYLAHQGVRIARRQPRGDAVTFVVTAKPQDIDLGEAS